MIIGRKGNILTKLKAKNKCSIHVATDPSEDDPSVKRITVSGASTNVSNCVKVPLLLRIAQFGPHDWCHRRPSRISS